MDKLIRVVQGVVIVGVVLWLGLLLKDNVFNGAGPLDAVQRALKDTAAFAEGVFDAMTDDLRLRAADREHRADGGPQSILVELDPTLSTGARGRIAAAFSSTWPGLLRVGDTFLIHHRYDRGRSAAVWAERTAEQTVRGSSEGLAAYVSAASTPDPALKAPPPAAAPPPQPVVDGDAGPPEEAAQVNEPPAAPVIPAGTTGSIVRNISGDLVGFTGANRIKLLAITEDLPHEQVREALMADGYGTIEEVGDDVMMGLDLHRELTQRLDTGESVVAATARVLLYLVVPILLVLSLLLGAKGARWASTVPHKRDAPMTYVSALYSRLSTIEARQDVPLLVDVAGLWIWRLFWGVLAVWVVLVLIAGGVPLGFLWLVPCMLVSALVVRARLWQDQRALVATVARSMQLHDFDDEVIGRFARENAALINEGAERIVTPYYGMGASSAPVVNERLMTLWTDIMGRDGQVLAHILHKQQQAALSLLRKANTVGPNLTDEDGTLKTEPGDPTVPEAGPAFGLIRKGYRGSGATKTAEGGEDAELTSRPAIVKFFLMAMDAIHTWLDDKMLANRAKRLANAVQQRRLLGQSLQDARSMTEDLESREIQRALDRAELEARLAKLSAKKRRIKRKARQGEAEAEEDFDHDYDDEPADDEPADDEPADDEVEPDDADNPDAGNEGDEAPKDGDSGDEAPKDDEPGEEPPDRP